MLRRRQAEEKITREGREEREEKIGFPCGPEFIE
jgi:hypothetical protein